MNIMEMLTIQTILGVTNIVIASVTFMRAFAYARELKSKPRPPLCQHCIPTVQIIQLAAIACVMYVGMEPQWIMQNIINGVVDDTREIAWLALELLMLIIIGKSVCLCRDVAMGKYSGMCHAE